LSMAVARVRELVGELNEDTPSSRSRKARP
jgi:hypothetical protein